MASEDDDPGAPAWMLTFSDCMTLLLTFFVLLLSFSSFDDWSLSQLAGALRHATGDSIFEDDRTRGDSVVPKRESVVDWTAKGSEKPDTLRPDKVRNPKHRELIVDTDAYRDQKILRISGQQLFLGNGCVLTNEGRQMLAWIASFMKLVPCKVIVGEVQSGSPTRADAAGGDDGKLLRSWAVLQFFVHRQGLPASRFRLAGARSEASWPSRDGPGIQISLLARDITE